MDSERRGYSSSVEFSIAAFWIREYGVAVEHSYYVETSAVYRHNISGEASRSTQK